LKTAAAVVRRCFEDTRTLSNCNEFVGQDFANDTLVAEKTACFSVLSSQRLESSCAFLKNCRATRNLFFKKRQAGTAAG
jgi:hypothetical protein